METVFISIMDRLTGRREEIGRAHGTDAAANGQGQNRRCDAVAGGALVLAGGAILTACSATAHSRAISVVASTDVWGPGVPVSVFVASISFLIYPVCWMIGRRRESAA